MTLASYDDLFAYVTKAPVIDETLSELQKFYTTLQNTAHNKEYNRTQYFNTQLSILARDKPYPSPLPSNSIMYDFVNGSKILADRAPKLTLVSCHNADFHVLVRHMINNWEEYDSIFRLYSKWLPPAQLVPSECFVTATERDIQTALTRRQNVLNKVVKDALNRYIYMLLVLTSLVSKKCSK
jgi:hypothetical protein